MKKILGILLVMLFLFACQTEKKETLTIGAILPLTGTSANIGKWQKQGIELATENIKNKHGVNIKFKFEDSQGNPKIGIDAFQKLALDNSIKAYLISISSIANSILPQLNKNPKPAFLLAVSLPGITDNSEYAIRFNLGSDDEARTMSEFLINNNYNKISVVYLNDEFGVGASEVFSNDFKNKGGIINYSDAYSVEQTDFKTIISKLSNYKNDGIYVIGYKKGSVLLIKQMRELGIKTQIFGNMALSIPSYLELAGNALDSAIFTVTSFDFEPNNKANIQFRNKYQTRFNEPPTFFSAFAYDALEIIFNNYRENISSSEYIKRLKDVTDYQGIMGRISINNDGTVNFPIIIVRNKNGKLANINE